MIKCLISIQEEIEQVAKILGWQFKLTSEGYYFFQIYSPEGHDYCIELHGNTYDQLIDELSDYIDNFDVSYETYLWLDNWGHGTNGAPYDMKDAYEDMEWCLDKTMELYNHLYNISY